jgi:hypothetical protein
MRFMTSSLAVILVAALSATAMAEEKASTSQLPAALENLGVSEVSVVSVAEADRVRGQGGFSLTQTKSFSITGTATGSLTLLEGVLGNFAFDNGAGLQTEGVFGGLAGSISGDSGGLTFQLGGKALQENVDFSGAFQQDFSQTFSY